MFLQPCGLAPGDRNVNLPDDFLEVENDLLAIYGRGSVSYALDNNVSVVAR
ncbi:MAG: hypothetical protein QXT73_00790 [Candidatus Methanomethylicaceae archaeon]